MRVTRALENAVERVVTGGRDGVELCDRGSARTRSVTVSTAFTEVIDGVVDREMEFVGARAGSAASMARYAPSRSIFASPLFLDSSRPDRPSPRVAGRPRVARARTDRKARRGLKAAITQRCDNGTSQAPGKSALSPRRIGIANHIEPVPPPLLAVLLRRPAAGQPLLSNALRRHVFDECVDLLRRAAAGR